MKYLKLHHRVLFKFCESSSGQHSGNMENTPTNPGQVAWRAMQEGKSDEEMEAARKAAEEKHYPGGGTQGGAAPDGWTGIAPYCG